MEPVRERSVRARAVVWATAVACSAFAFGMTLLVPPNMDEMSHYHPIHCLLFPAAYENVFREGCGQYDLEYFGRWLPIRSYYYIGGTPSLQYLPFHLLLPSYHAARLLGVVALLAFAWALQRASGAPGWVALLLSLVPFPFAFQMLINTGTLHYLCFAAVLLPWCLARNRSVSCAVVLGLLLFLGIEQKLIFLAMLPSMAVLGFGFLAERATVRRPLGTLLRERWAALAAAAGVAVLATSALLAGRDRRGALYASELFERDPSFASDLPLLAQLGRTAQKLGAFLASFNLFGERVYEGRAGPDAVTMAAWALIAATIVLGLRHASRRGALAGSLAAVLMMALVLVSLAESRHGHHFVLVFPFLLLSLAIALRFLLARRPRLAIGLVLAFTATQLATWVEVVRQRPAAHDDWSKVAVLEKLRDERLASEYVYVVLDWGMYYLLALYGPRNETLVYLDPVRSEASFRQLEPLRELAARKGMRLAFIHRRPSESDLRRLAREVGPLERIPVPGAPRAVWQVRAQSLGFAASRAVE